MFQVLKQRSRMPHLRNRTQVRQATKLIFFLAECEFARQLLRGLLDYYPERRLSAGAALREPYIRRRFEQPIGIVVGDKKQYFARNMLTLGT